MRIVIQRVTQASVSVQPDYYASIGAGMVVLVGVENGDSVEDVEFLVKKTASLRVFDDSDGVMNLPVQSVGGEILAVSQFTLLASTKKGNRPSYIRSARGEEARSLYDEYCRGLSMIPGITVKKGVFGADMAVALVNDGPVTIIIDSKLKE